MGKWRYGNIKKLLQATEIESCGMGLDSSLTPLELLGHAAVPSDATVIRERSWITDLLNPRAGSPPLAEREVRSQER